jgi:ABC-type uncharacterized transport system fused permease/ATPase subunit
MCKLGSVRLTELIRGARDVLADNVLGTLQEQICYPNTTRAAALSRERLAEILEVVDLAHLVDINGYLTDEVDWENEISYGERQRLAIARLVYSCPRFAILDECTSAVTREMEQRLYSYCSTHRISFITIAHRPALQAYHKRMLTIGEGECGFNLSDIDSSRSSARALVIAKVDEIPKNVEQSIKKHAETRSEDYRELLSSTKPQMPSRSMWKRSLRIWSESKPDWPKSKFAMLLAFLVADTLLEHISFNITGLMFAALLRQDGVGFARLVALNLTTAVGQMLVGQCQSLISVFSGLVTVMKVKRQLIERLCANNTFYYVMNIDRRIRDVEQIIVRDSNGFMGNMNPMDVGMSVVRPVLKVAFFTQRIGTVAGWRWSVVLVIYFFISMQALRLAMPDYRWLWQKMSKLESRFAAVHRKVKASSEAVAFFDGGNAEKANVDGRFDALMAHDWSRNFMQFKVRVVSDVFQARIPEVAQYVIRFAFGYLVVGSDAEVLADHGLQLNHGQTYLMSTLPVLFSNLGAVIGLSDRLHDVAGRVERVAELQEVLDEVEARQAEDRVAERARVEAQQQHHEIRFDAADVVTPNGEAIAVGLSCRIRPGNSLMVTGRNATGKSAFVRVLSGLWPLPQLSEGKIVRPGPPLEANGAGGPRLSDIFVVPQRILSAPGTLADQITYPQSILRAERTPAVEARLQGLLDQVGVGYLVDRWAGDAQDTVMTIDGVPITVVSVHGEDSKGWDAAVTWEDVLSLGEQQRLVRSRVPRDSTIIHATFRHVNVQLATEELVG